MHCTSPTPLLVALAVVTLLLPFIHAQFDTVSINAAYPHGCVDECVFDSIYAYYGIEALLGCAKPVANKCYCATASASASRVESWVAACAADRCGSGDAADDVVAMKSIYASYCLQAGYTAPIVSGWYTAPATTSVSRTATSGALVTSSAATSPPTVTRVTVSTQTSATSDARSSSQQVIVEITSTQWINAQGSLLPTSVDAFVGIKTPAFAISLGVGIPVVVIAIGIGIWLCVRRRRRRKSQIRIAAPEMSYAAPVAAPTKAAPLLRKPVNSPRVRSEPPSPLPFTTELAGGEGVRGEVSGRELHPFPVIEGGQRPVVVPGQHELYAEVAGPPPYHVKG